MKNINLEEVWKPVVGYEGLYEVSNLGRVRSLRYKKIKKLSLTKYGYYIVGFCINYKNNVHLVHRLVAEAFLPNPNNLPEVDYINTDRTDNRLENLRWVTRKENMNNPITIERAKDTFNKKTYHEKEKCLNNLKLGRLGHKLSEETKMKISKSHSKPIIQLKLNGEFVRVWESAYKAQKETGMCQASIQRCLVGKQQTTYNYKWIFVNDR